MEKCLKVMAMFHLLRIRTSIDIFKNEKCKVTFGLEYIIQNQSTCIYKTTLLQTKIKVGISCYLFNSSLDLVQGIKQSSRNVFRYILKKC